MKEVTKSTLLDSLKDPTSRQKAFTSLVSLYKSRVYGVVRKMVIDHDDADDVVQEVFIKLWKEIDRYRGDSELFTWIYRIASNEALQFLRKKKRRMLFSGDYREVLAQHLDNAVGMDGDEIQLKLQKAILTLPDKQRLIFNFKYYEELKYEEIAAITGTSVGGLKASYHHAVKKIENYLVK